VEFGHLYYLLPCLNGHGAAISRMCGGIGTRVPVVK
jgi:50S ribosomal subunit-associated GTPase HflX